MSSLVEFVRSLELDESLTLDSPSAKVVAGSIASFTSKLSGQQLEDVQNSTLLAQLAANKKFPDEEDFVDWYKFYRHVLSQLGWIMQDLGFDKYKSQQASFKLSQVTLELLSATVGEEEQLFTVVKYTLESLAESPHGQALFKANSASGQNGRFQILPCTVTNGQVSLAFIGAYFKASQVSDDFFFFSYESQYISLHKATQVFTLNEAVYGEVRQIVMNKLGSHAHKFIDDLQL